MTSINRNSGPGAHFLIVPLKGEPLDAAPVLPPEPKPAGLGRAVDQFVGPGGPPPVALGAGPSGVDVSNYGAAVRQKLDLDGDGKLNAKELEAAKRVADVNGDGIVGLGEQRALDYLLGHDTSDFGKKTFESLHGGEPGGVARRAAESNAAEQKAGQKYDGLNQKLDRLSHQYERIQQDMIQVGKKQGIETSPDSAKVLEQRLSKLEPSDPKRGEVEFQLAFAKMKLRQDDELVALNQEKLDARAQFETAKVVNRGAQQLYAAAAAALK